MSGSHTNFETAFPLGLWIRRLGYVAAAGLVLTLAACGTAGEQPMVGAPHQRPAQTSDNAAGAPSPALRSSRRAEESSQMRSGAPEAEGAVVDSLADEFDFSAPAAVAENDGPGRDRRNAWPSGSGHAAPGVPRAPSHSGEGYASIEDNSFQRASREPLSTFSIDVDTASYANVRRYVTQGQLPPPDAVRIEEMVNYFDYDYPQPRGDEPFSITVDSMPAPWQRGNRLVRVGVQAHRVSRAERPAANLVFLIDVSGSMADENKLPLLKDSLAMLVGSLREEDRVSIVTYAGQSGVALDPTSGAKHRAIRRLIESLAPGGSTAGSAGIVQAYEVAHSAFLKGGINRVILCTDGDFNVGITEHDGLERLIEDEAAGGVFLTVLGFGMGNYQDDTLELLADKGNGNYAYIDTAAEARKVLGEEAASTLIAVAKDVKIQVEFNPRHVGAYRLIGYENRMLASEDFADDTKDAGDVGSGHSVTALYEVEPATNGDERDSDAFRYGAQPAAEDDFALTEFDDELMFVKLRYKPVDGQRSRLITKPVGTDLGSHGGDDLRFAAAVAAFGMLLRESPFAGSADFDMVLDLAEDAASDPLGYRQEFVALVRSAEHSVARGW